MTNETKLLKLLQVAVENGYVKYGTSLPDNWYLLPIKEGNFTSLMWKTHRGTEFVGINLNGLITNFEKGEVSFIEALWQAVLTKNVKCDVNGNLTDYYTIEESFRIDWILQPTSKRLDWLFEIFSHLID